MTQYPSNFYKKFVSALFIFFSFAGLAAACSCMPFSLTQSYERADNVLLVEVYAIETTKQPQDKHDQGERIGYFNVIESFKQMGSVEPFITSVDKPVCCMCGATVKLGTYLVFSNNGKPVYYSSCSSTSRVDLDSDELVKLRKLKDAANLRHISGIIDTKKRLFTDDAGKKYQIDNLRDYYFELRKGQFQADVTAVFLSDGEIMITKLKNATKLAEPEKKQDESNSKGLSEKKT